MTGSDEFVATLSTGMRTEMRWRSILNRVIGADSSASGFGSLGLLSCKAPGHAVVGHVECPDALDCGTVL